MLLDFSQKDIWMKAGRLAIEEVIPPNIISLAQQEDPDTMFEDDLNYIIKHWESLDPWISVERLTDNFDRCICHHFRKIKGFHACRITNEDSYRKHGLRKLSKELLLELALERFGSFANSIKIEQACNKWKILENDTGVYFFPSLDNAMDPSQNHYLKCGSETLQGISCDLGLNNRGILSSQGRSCIIECNIPINQIKQGFRISIWNMIITGIFREEAGKVINEDVLDIGYTTYGKVEPECIQKFHYIKDSSYRYTLNRH
jgi:hypothetical protein